MRVFVVLLALLSFTLAKVSIFQDSQVYQKILRKDKLKGAIIATVNEFADKILKNLGPFTELHGLEPIVLGNISEHFLSASIHLNNGSIKGISNAARNGDAEVVYEHSTSQLLLNLPLVFQNISFSYDYDVLVFLVGPKGKLTGTIKNFKLSLRLSFSFKTYKAKVDYVKTSDSGHITVHFDGNMTDIILNILMQFVTTFLHPFLQGVIEGIIKIAANSIIDGINKLIYDIRYPNSTDYFMPEKYQQFVKLY